MNAENERQQVPTTDEERAREFSRTAALMVQEAIAMGKAGDAAEAQAMATVAQVVASVGQSYATLALVAVTRKGNRP